MRAFDPAANAAARRLYGDRPDFTLCERAEDALNGADGLVIVTEWQEFRSPDFEIIKAALSAPVIFDGRNLYDPDVMRKLGFQYFGIGRGDSVALAAGDQQRSASAVS